MSLRREREKAELKRARAYEAALALGAAVLGAALLAAFWLGLHATVLAPREGAAPPPATGVSDLPAGRPVPPRP